MMSDSPGLGMPYSALSMGSNWNPGSLIPFDFNSDLGLSQGSQESEIIFAVAVTFCTELHSNYWFISVTYILCLALVLLLPKSGQDLNPYPRTKLPVSGHKEEDSPDGGGFQQPHFCQEGGGP